MKKFTSLLLLLLTMFLWGGVDVVAQSFTVSDAPSDGAWAQNTHWYTIKTHTSEPEKSGYFYLSTNEKGTAPNGCLVINDPVEINGKDNKSADDIWCIVQTADGKLQFYNYVDGPSKVLGVTGYTGNGENGRAKMYDASTTEEGVKTLFEYKASETKLVGENKADAFYVSGVAKSYLNNRNGYLAFWIADGAVGSGCYGSAFTCEEVSTEELSQLITKRYNQIVEVAENVKNQMTGHVGDLFSYSDDQLSKLAGLIPAVAPSTPLEMAAKVRELKAFFAEANASSTMPTAGKRYALRNAQYNSYIEGPFCVTDGTGILGATSLTKKRQCWVLEEASAGKYRLKNAVTGYYIRGSQKVCDFNSYPEFKPEPYKMYLGSNQEFRLYPNLGGRPLTVQIGTGDNYNNLHMNSTNTLVEWETAEASSWYLEEVSEEKYASLESSDKKVLDACSIAQILPVKLGTVSSTLNAYNATTSEENASAFIDAVEASTYVRIKNRQTNLGLGVLDDFSHANCNDWSMGDAGLIWKLQPIDDKGTLKLKLLHLNTQKYLGPVGTNNPHSDAPMCADLKSGATWSFTPKNTNYFTLRDGANGVMNCEDGANKGKINQWNGGVEHNQTQWTVTIAENIEVALTAVGDHTYATTFLPFPVSAVSEGVKAYTGSYDANQKLVTLKETAAIPVNTGVVLMGETAAATTATLTIGVNATMTEKSDFEGATTAIALDDNNRSNYLVLGRKSDAQSEIGFFKPLASKIPANRAYIRNFNGSGVSSVNVNFGTVEGIGSVVTETAEDANSPIFDLSGRRVMHTVKGGLYIRNGKKFLVK